MRTSQGLQPTRALYPKDAIQVVDVAKDAQLLCTFLCTFLCCLGRLQEVDLAKLPSMGCKKHWIVVGSDTNQ